MKPPAQNYAPPQQIPVNYANHQAQTTGYQVPIRDSTTQYGQAPPVSRHSSHSHRHHASRMRGDEDDGVRRSSSSSHHRSEYERERAEAAYGDRYERDAPRRSTSSRHAHRDNYGEPRQEPATRYAEPPRQDSSAKYGATGYPTGYSNSTAGYTNAYTNGYAAEPPRSSHSHHSSHSRHRDSRDGRYDDEPRRRDGQHYDDGQHKRKWSHGWLSALGRLFRWPHHHRHEKVEIAAKA
ncbi:hypothetical protein PsYK624_071950 [Phanerochaete sordida]|uniref:Uncharacterized protein n=1 Tax=Phanerochaete sordida TaxID=48140 RepID=A0A9P3LEJ3_9APHY|nr:hypothetical protein PsYK624_071950 [Phanerochaete sordida]